MFNNVSHKETRELSFKLILPLGSNVTFWKDLDLSVTIWKDHDISQIASSAKYPAKYSRTEKLFDIMSMRFPHYTIGVFLHVLKKLEINDIENY